MQAESTERSRATQRLREGFDGQPTSCKSSTERRRVQNTMIISPQISATTTSGSSGHDYCDHLKSIRGSLIKRESGVRLDHHGDYRPCALVIKGTRRVKVLVLVRPKCPRCPGVATLKTTGAATRQVKCNGVAFCGLEPLRVLFGNSETIRGPCGAPPIKGRSFQRCSLVPRTIIRWNVCIISTSRARSRTKELQINGCLRYWPAFLFCLAPYIQGGPELAKKCLEC